MRIIICLILLSLVVGTSASAFELDGFKNGLSYDNVKKNTLVMKNKKVQYSDNIIEAFDLTESENENSYVFVFCSNSLGYVQKQFKPTQDNYFKIINEYSKKYGKPIKAETIVEQKSYGEVKASKTYWKNGLDTYYVYYGGSPGYTSLYIDVAYNNCSW